MSKQKTLALILGVVGATYGLTTLDLPEINAEPAKTISTTVQSAVECDACAAKRAKSLEQPNSLRKVVRPDGGVVTKKVYDGQVEVEDFTEPQTRVEMESREMQQDTRRRWFRGGSS